MIVLLIVWQFLSFISSVSVLLKSESGTSSTKISEWCTLVIKIITWAINFGCVISSLLSRQQKSLTDYNWFYCEDLDLTKHCFSVWDVLMAINNCSILTCFSTINVKSTKNKSSTYSRNSEAFASEFHILYLYSNLYSRSKS